MLSAKSQLFCLVKREMFYDVDKAFYAHLIEFYLGLTQVSFTYIPQVNCIHPGESNANDISLMNIDEWI